MVPSALLFLALVLAVGAHALPFQLCEPCRGESCLIDPPDCTYGAVTVCGRRVCGKALGQKCGGYQDEYGKCGKNMKCVCGRCSGCTYVDELSQCLYLDPSKCLF